MRDSEPYEEEQDLSEEDRPGEERGSGALWRAAGWLLAVVVAVAMVAGIAVPVVASFFSSTDEAANYRASIRPSSVALLDSTAEIAQVAANFRDTGPERDRLSDAADRIVAAAEHLRRITPPEAYAPGHRALVQAADQYASAARYIEDLLIGSSAGFVSEEQALTAVSGFQRARELMEHADQVLRGIDERAGIRR